MQKHVLIPTIGMALAFLLYTYLAYSREIPSGGMLDYTWVGICGILVSYSIYGLTQLLDQLIPWQKAPGTRFSSGIFVHSIVAIFLTNLLAYTLVKIRNPIESVFEAYPNVFIKLAILIFVCVLLYSVIYFAIYSLNHFTKGQILQVKSERKQIDLQLIALKAQLSPHFLFNSLNTISSLMNKDVQKAESFVRMLAKSYQYTLSTYEQKWVSLREELDFVYSYQYLLKTRFEDHLAFSIDIPEEKLDQKIPPLTLQMLVENAVKHNQLLAENPLHIKIGIDDVWLWVSNNKTQAPKGVPSFKIGLKNIRSRYKLLTGKDIHVENEDTFTVKLPVIS
ncbi:MAG: histidine kinase [Bacteroidota bacterium]